MLSRSELLSPYQYNTSPLTLSASNVFVPQWLSVTMSPLTVIQYFSSRSPRYPPEWCIRPLMCAVPLRSALSSNVSIVLINFIINQFPSVFFGGLLTMIIFNRLSGGELKLPKSCLPLRLLLTLGQLLFLPLKRLPLQALHTLSHSL